ncbi:hypothetical protein [Spongiactinospora sp. TRM90649]|uniref:hypothetical protein n=1 Tax=Spongiactinospora sp. TRM90649 TaxID=3031114 RepID=UPI0023F9F567|nr:hypothetical protein [Spongiactinospora sp. TRM90649]MDF5757044.1 hypothetical protein [Spongiactinospora sp. TRM90649]
MDHEQELTPGESLRLIETQQAAAQARIDSNPRHYYLPWGVSLMVGFTTMFLYYGPSPGRPILHMPPWLALGVLFTALIAAGVISVGLEIRNRVEVQGGSADRGMMYGFAWLVGQAGSTAISVHFQSYLPGEQRGLLWATLSLAMVSVLYVAGAAVWRQWSMFALGLGVGVVNVLGMQAGPGWHALLVAVLCGGGFLLAGALAGKGAR